MGRVPHSDSPQEPHLLVLGVVVRHDLGCGDADLHAVHHELACLLQGLLLPFGILR